METYGIYISGYCAYAKVVDLNNDRLPFEDDTFDFVFSKSVVEHISNTERYLLEMKCVCKHGRCICIMVPDWETRYKIICHDSTHIHPYIVSYVEILLNMMELKEVTSKKFVQLPSVCRAGIMAVLS